MLQSSHHTAMPRSSDSTEALSSLWRLQITTLGLTYTRPAGPDRRPGAFKVRCQARTGGSSSLEREVEEAQPQGSLSRCRMMRRHGLISPATQHSRRAQDQYADDTRQWVVRTPSQGAIPCHSKPRSSRLEIRCKNTLTRAFRISRRGSPYKEGSSHRRSPTGREPLARTGGLGHQPAAGPSSRNSCGVTVP